MTVGRDLGGHEQARRGVLRLVVALCVAATACGDDGPPAGDGPTAGESTSTSDASTGSSVGGSSVTGLDTTADATTSTADGSTGGSASECWDDLPVGEVEVLYEGFTEGSEGLAFGSSGPLFATTDGVVWRIEADGSVTEHAQVPDALGLAALADGSLVVASIGINGQPDGALYLVDPEGVASLLATGIDSPNFVTITPEGSALVSDDFDTRVFRVTMDGQVDVVIQDIASPNGMAYSPAGDALFVVSTFEATGPLTRFEVDGSGLPVEASAVEILHLGPGSTPDGIAVDEDGWVYVAANLLGEIWRVDGTAPAVVEGERVAQGLGSPASLAFGRGPGFDPCSIYATQLFGDQVLRVSVGVRGAPLYD